MSYENDLHLNNQVDLVECKHRLAEAESRISTLEQALEQLSRDYADLALVAATPKSMHRD
jgi:uncharacterized protein YhaN